VRSEEKDHAKYYSEIVNKEQSQIKEQEEQSDSESESSCERSSSEDETERKVMIEVNNMKIARQRRNSEAAQILNKRGFNGKKNSIEECISTLIVPLNGMGIKRKASGSLNTRTKGYAEFAKRIDFGSPVPAN
jgi:hypothetical protein